MYLEKENDWVGIGSQEASKAVGGESHGAQNIIAAKQAIECTFAARSVAEKRCSVDRGDLIYGNSARSRIKDAFS